MPFGTKHNQAHVELRAALGLKQHRSAVFAPVLSSLVAFLMLGTAIAPAQALELFGYEIGLDGISKVSETESDASVPDPVTYDVTLNVPDEDIRETLEAASLLIEQKDKPASGTVGLLLRMRNDRKRLLASLYEEGRYGGVVDVTVNGRAPDEVALDEDLSTAGKPAVRINVTPGPVFTFSQPQVTDASGNQLDVSTFGLVEGDVAKSDLVLDAENALVDRYQREGYPFAAISNRVLEADHRTQKLDVLLEVAPGEQARLGSVSVSGAKDVDSDFIAQQANIPQGELYSPEETRAAAKRLRSLGVFESVIVKPGKEVLADGTVPMMIEVKERKPRTIGAGITVGNLDGIGLEGFWTHRNLFGKAEKLRIESSVSRIGQDDFSQIDYHGAVLFSKPGVFGPTTTFESELAADYINPDAFEKRSVSAEVALRKDFNEQLSGRAGLKVEYSRLTDDTGTDNRLLTSIPLEMSYDTRDNQLDPTEGFQILLQAEPTAGFEQSNYFLKTSATAMAYQALDDAKRFVLAGKVSAGTIFGASKKDVPADRRFFTGGGGSIRGYAYQAAGPRNSKGAPEGGRSFAIASAEARVRVTDSIGLAAFVDTGGAFDGLTPGDKGDWYTGVGAGIRYLTPIGPLRLDVAVPLKKIHGEPQYGVYLGLGQAF
ncbi:autotransporter assembly complex family protein [Cohaesibacter sp. ES.047]|uniref:autotransporter assembly complex protein TamA n=1 Tax=Cohaesibacter sp. ES.047 TaxID=1798205 RepID=UPI00155FBAD4|nr:autotransporter assembly complex family protein [Cohaesibacter sp. ES.047]